MRPRDDHRRPRRAGRARAGAGRRPIRRRPRRGPRRGSATQPVERHVRDRRRAQPRLSRRRVRCRPCPPGAAARRRSGAGAAGDAASVSAGRNRRGAGCGLRRLHLVSAAARRWTCGWTSTRRRPVPTAANRMPAGGCCRGPSRPASTTSRRRAASGATRRPRPGNGGAECGPTGFFTRPWPASSWHLGLATTAQLEEISAAWRAWAAARDGWLSMPHGEILCRA